MPSRSKKHQIARLRRKRFLEDAAQQGAILGVDEFGIVHIDGNKLKPTT